MQSSIKTVSSYSVMQHVIRCSFNNLLIFYKSPWITQDLDIICGCNATICYAFLSAVLFYTKKKTIIRKTSHTPGYLLSHFLSLIITTKIRLCCLQNGLPNDTTGKLTCDDCCIFVLMEKDKFFFPFIYFFGTILHTKL